MTIAIPTRNRAPLLKKALASALAQDYSNLQILVLDNASSDETTEVVRASKDARINYVRHNENIGLVSNWCSAVQLADTTYLSILQDDDELRPGFCTESVRALEESPQAAVSFTHVRFIDVHGKPLHLQPVPSSVRAGVINGHEFLVRIADGDNWVIHASSAVMRKTAVSEVGSFDTSHSKHAIEFNLYFRLAQNHDLVFIPHELVNVRHHSEQSHRTSTRGTAPLAMISERMDAAAYLLQSPYASDSRFRSWLSERLLHMSVQRSQFASYLLPDLNLTWTEREAVAIACINAAVREEDTLVLIDDWSMDPSRLSPRTCRFIGDGSGEIAGSPASSESAIDSLERLRREGARHLVVTWPAFWWLDIYSGFRDHLHSGYRCTTQNSSVIIYDIADPKRCEKRQFERGTWETLV